MTHRQNLLLFLISSDPGVKDIYSLVRLFDKAEFPALITENLKPMLDEGLIIVSKNFDNGTPSDYEITEKGKKYLENLDDDEIINYVSTMPHPEILLEITKTYIDKKNLNAQGNKNA